MNTGSCVLTFFSLIQNGSFHPSLVFGLLLLLVIFFGIGWFRERTLSRQRRIMRSMMNLSEDILASATPAEVAGKIEAALPRLLNASLVEMYVLRQGLASLERLTATPQSKSLVVSIDSPVGALPAIVALCFRNRALLEVPDASRTPLFDAGSQPRLARAALFVPMFAGMEVLGVLAIQYPTQNQRTPPERQAGLQHLANQIGASFKLQERKAMQDQLLRSEKLAAAGQLISAVVADLRAPLASIADLASRSDRNRQPPLPEMQQIATYARRGVELLSHLTSLTGIEQGDITSFDVISLASDMVALRQRECAHKGIRMESRLALASVLVSANRSQVEQLVLSLLVQAEHSALSSAGKLVQVDSHVIGKKIQIAIQAPGSALHRDSDLKVSQTIAENCGGQVRYGSDPGRLEIELPVQPVRLPESDGVEPSADPARILNIAVLEASALQERQLVALLSARGHRVVPIKDGEQAADLVQRFEFDVVFCCLRPPGVNWVELFSRVRRKVKVFVLLTDVETCREELFPNADGYVLSRPIQSQELNHVLAAAP